MTAIRALAPIEETTAVGLLNTPRKWLREHWNRKDDVVPSVLREIRKIRVAAVALGVMIDVVGSVATGILLVIFMVANGIPDSEIIPRLNSLSGLLLKLLSVLGFTVVGGFFAGYLARQVYLLHGALVGTVGLFLSFLCLNGYVSPWYLAVHYLGMVPAGVAGGYFAMQEFKDYDRQTAMHGRS